MTAATPADLLARLIEAGTPPALIAEVALQLAGGEADRARRAGAAARQAKSRARKGEAAAACDGHAPSPDVTAAPPALDKEASPRPPEEINLIPVGGAPVGGAPAREAPPSRPPAAFPRPGFVDPPVWRDFLANRRMRGLANTASAHRALMAEIAALASDDWPPGRLIAHAAAQGWGRVYDPEKPHRKKESRHAETSRVPLFEPATDRPHHPPAAARSGAGERRAERRADGADDDSTFPSAIPSGHRERSRAGALPRNPRLRAALELAAGGDGAGG